MRRAVVLRGADLAHLIKAVVPHRATLITSAPSRRLKFLLTPSRSLDEMNRAFVLTASAALLFCSPFAALAQPPAESTESQPSEESEGEDRDETPERNRAPEAAQGSVELGRMTVRPIASFLTRYELRRGYDRQGLTPPSCSEGDGDCVRFRLRLGVDLSIPLKRGVRAGIRFSPQTAGRLAASPGSSGGVVNADLGVYEALFRIDVRERWQFELGRFSMAYGEELVIGALGWLPAARTFDGGRLRYLGERAHVDGFVTLLREGAGALPGSGDDLFYGLYTSLAPSLPDAMELDVYVLGLRRSDATTTSNRGHLGTRFRAQWERLDLRVEAGLQAGAQETEVGRRAILAGHVNAELGIRARSTRWSAELSWASGDNPDSDRDEAYQHLFPTAHAFLGLSDAMGARTNVAAATLHGSIKPHDAWSIRVDGHLFARPQAQDMLTGAETDVIVSWTPLEGLSARIVYGLFAPIANSYASTSAVHYLEMGLSYAL